MMAMFRRLRDGIARALSTVNSALQQAAEAPAAIPEPFVITDWAGDQVIVDSVGDRVRIYAPEYVDLDPDQVVDLVMALAARGAHPVNTTNTETD